MVIFFFKDTATTEIYTLSLHDALPIFDAEAAEEDEDFGADRLARRVGAAHAPQAKVVAQRAVDEQPPERIEQPPPSRGRAAAQAPALERLGQLEEEAHDLALGPRAVLDADHH